MRFDELCLLQGGAIVLHPKRLAYLKRKWARKGMMAEGKWTVRGEYVIGCIKDTRRSEYLDSSDHHVCILHTINWMPPVCGILMNCGDNGYHFTTVRSEYYLGCGWNLEDSIAYIEPHLNPGNLWRKYNYHAYMKNPKYNQDYWHMKYKEYGWERPPVGYSVGDCMPCCQCKKLSLEN